MARVFKAFIEMKDEIIGIFVSAEQRQRLIYKYFIVMCNTERAHYGINFAK